jgi:hypothetical protein
LLSTGSVPPSTATAPGVLQQGAQAPAEPTPSEVHATHCDKEATCLADLHGLASRTGDLLKLKLDDGKTRTFRSNPKACDDDAQNCNVTALVGFMPPLHMFVLRSGGYEIVRYLVVSGRDGKSFDLEAEPRLAPDGRHFVVVAADEMNGWERDVAIYSTASFPPRLEWSYRTEKTDPYSIYSFAGWDGNGRIKLRVSGADKETETEVTRTAEGWTLKLTNGELRTGVSAVQQNQRRAGDRPS